MSWKKLTTKANEGTRLEVPRKKRYNDPGNAQITLIIHTYLKSLRFKYKARNWGASSQSRAPFTSHSQDCKQRIVSETFDHLDIAYKSFVLPNKWYPWRTGPARPDLAWPWRSLTGYFSESSKDTNLKLRHNFEAAKILNQKPSFIFNIWHFSWSRNFAIFSYIFSV